MLENAIITILLYDRDSEFYISQLSEDDFTNQLARQTFSIMKKMYENGEKIDAVKVSNQMPFSEEFWKLFSFNAGMVVSNIDDYVQQLKKETVRRKAKKIIHDCENKLINGDEVTEVINSILKSLDEIDTLSSSKLIDLGKLESNYVERERVISGFSSLDKLIGGFNFGELSVWSGRSGQGKSTFLSQVILEAVNKGYKVCAYSGELFNTQFQNWIELQACGNEHLEKRYDTIKQHDVYLPSKEAETKIKQWLTGKFYLYNNEFTCKDNNIIDVFKYAYKHYGCKVFLVDNLMTAKYESSNRDNYYLQQSIFVGELVRFAKTNNVIVHLIAHPKKTQGELTKEDISGSLDITNRADNAFTVNREDDGTTRVKILKNRSQGIQGQFLLFDYDAKTKRFTPRGNDFAKYKKYGWEHE